MAALDSSAAQIVDKVIKKEGTAKSLVINNRFPKKKKLYALVCETLKYKYRGILEDIFKQSRLLKLEKKLKQSYALVLVYDLLFGQGVQCGGELKQCISRNKAALQSCLARLKVRAKVHRNEDLLPKAVLEAGSIPRYVRINRLKTSLEAVIQDFKQSGYQLVEPQTIASFVTQSKNSSNKEFMCDNHLSDVLVFPAGTDLHNHPLYVSGCILLQDKASCLPAHVLAAPPGSHVIDACAAPGNKSSHMASLMNNKGKIFAFDPDSKRLRVMQNLMRVAGVECVAITNCSFLEVDPSDEKYSQVQYIVLDPSCSGSGIASRMDNLIDDTEDECKKEQRLESLAKFQLSVLNHALSFPFIKRVVYSTCSIHQQENEDVVQAALKANGDRYRLEYALPSWTHRGLAVFPGAEKCIRASPEEDYTNEFFVALFVRKDNETEQIPTKSNGVSHKRKRKNPNEDTAEELSSQSVTNKDRNEESSLPLAHFLESSGNNLSPRKKRRKRNKKLKDLKAQEENQPKTSRGSLGLSNVKKKKEPKKEEKSFCLLLKIHEMFIKDSFRHRTLALYSPVSNSQSVD